MGEKNGGRGRVLFFGPRDFGPKSVGSGRDFEAHFFGVDVRWMILKVDEHLSPNVSHRFFFAAPSFSLKTASK